MEIKVKEIVNKYNLSLNEVADYIGIDAASITDDYIHEFGNADDLDCFAKKFKLGCYNVVKIRCFGKVRNEVAFFNYLTEDFENGTLCHKELLKEYESIFDNEKEAEEAMEAIDAFEESEA